MAVNELINIIKKIKFGDKNFKSNYFIIFRNEKCIDHFLLRSLVRIFIL